MNSTISIVETAAGNKITATKSNGGSVFTDTEELCLDLGVKAEIESNTWGVSVRISEPSELAGFYDADFDFNNSTIVLRQDKH